jgi:hypothetical protein
MGFYLNEYLVAQGISLRKRVSELFDQLAKDQELAQVFIRNPIVVLQSKVFPEFPIADEASGNAANELLYSVLNNEKFMKWTEEYQKSLVEQYNRTGKIPERKELLQDLAKGIMEHGDPKILSDLLALPEAYLPEMPLGFRHVWYYVEFYAWAYVYFFYYLIFAFGLPNKVSILDENQKIVTISPKELRSLAEQMIQYAKKMREQGKGKTPKK